MFNRLIAATAVLFTSTIFPANAEVAVASGGRVMLRTVGAFDQVCHSLGPMTVNVTQPPRAGTITAERILGYPNFPAYNTRSRCNTMKLPQTRVMYQSTPGYIGWDDVEFEMIGPLGQVTHSRFVISVREGVVSSVPDATVGTSHVHHRHRAVKTATVATPKHVVHEHKVKRPPKTPSEDQKPVAI